VADRASVASFVAARDGPLHFLVNNAVVMARNSSIRVGEKPARQHVPCPTETGFDHHGPKFFFVNGLAERDQPAGLLRRMLSGSCFYGLFPFRRR